MENDIFMKQLMLSKSFHIVSTPNWCAYTFLLITLFQRMVTNSEDVSVVASGEIMRFGY